MSIRDWFGENLDSPIFGCIVAGTLLLAALPGRTADLTRPATSIVRYDASWHPDNFWSGENPIGFGVFAPRMVAIRAQPNLTAPRSVACKLNAPSVYHPFNEARVLSDKLVFRSYTKIAEGTLWTAYTGRAENATTHAMTRLDLKPGTHVRTLAYGGEGVYLIEIHRTRYWAPPGDYSIPWPPLRFDDANYHQWLGLTCANGVRGWLFTQDVEGLPGVVTMRYYSFDKGEDLCDVATAIAQSVCKVH
jgi:hypothetical protein